MKLDGLRHQLINYKIKIKIKTKAIILNAKMIKVNKLKH